MSEKDDRIYELETQVDDLESELTEWRDRAEGAERQADEIDDLEIRIQELVEELDERPDALDILTTDVPHRDSELYRLVYQPLYERWVFVTGGGFQPSFEELADFYLDESKGLEYWQNTEDELIREQEGN